MIVLVDIDHTISASWVRDHLLGNGDWDLYHLKAVDDDPIPELVAAVNALQAQGFTIVAFTARPEKWRNLTMDWLVKHGVHVDELLMRDNNDFRTAPEIKVDLAKNRFPNLAFEVSFILEDRDDVVAAFRELGVTCLQVWAGQK